MGDRYFETSQESSYVGNGAVYCIWGGLNFFSCVLGNVLDPDSGSGRIPCFLLDPDPDSGPRTGSGSGQEDKKK